LAYIHHGLEQGQFTLNGVTEEVRVDKDGVRGFESLIVLEEE
jgi:hypothetical protein